MKHHCHFWQRQLSLERLDPDLSQGHHQTKDRMGASLSHFPRLQIPRKLMACKYPQGLSLNCIYIIFVLHTFPGQSYMSHCLHFCKPEPTAATLFSDHKKIVPSVCYLSYPLLPDSSVPQVSIP